MDDVRSDRRTSVDFHFDIMCPYAYQTSLWIRHVREETGLDIRWRFFSLEEINRQEGKKHPWEREWSYGWSMMRIGALLRAYNPNRDVYQYDTEWGMICSTPDGKEADYENRNANIIGTMHRAVRLIYYAREGFLRGAMTTWWWADRGLVDAKFPPGNGTYRVAHNSLILLYADGRRIRANFHLAFEATKDDVTGFLTNTRWFVKVK